MRNYTTAVLVVYSVVTTAWLSVCFYENKLQQKTHEHIILEYEKMLLEYEVAEGMNCNPVETKTEEKPYTYDQWISSKPCPKGRHGPLCHMNPPEAQ